MSSYNNQVPNRKIKIKMGIRNKKGCQIEKKRRKKKYDVYV